MKLFFALGVLLTAVIGAFAADAPQGPLKEIPELQPLHHFVGDWDSRMIYKSTAAEGQSEIKGKSSSEWVHGGHFVRQTWSHDGGGGLPAGTGSTMMTYDPDTKIYRSWMYFSSGSVIESEGKWDPKTSTFNWTSRDDRLPMKLTTTATFKEDGTEQWSLVEKDADGKVVMEATGTNTRGKEKE